MNEELRRIQQKRIANDYSMQIIKKLATILLRLKNIKKTHFILFPYLIKKGSLKKLEELTENIKLELYLKYDPTKTIIK